MPSITTTNRKARREDVHFRAFYRQTSYEHQLNTYVETQVRRMRDLPISPEEVVERLHSDTERTLTIGYTVSRSVRPMPLDSSLQVDGASAPNHPQACRPGNCTGFNCMVLVDLLQSVNLHDNNNGSILGQGDIISDCFNSLGAPNPAGADGAIPTARRTREPSEELFDYEEEADDRPETSAQGAARRNARFKNEFYLSDSDDAYSDDDEGYSPLESADEVEEAELLRVRADPTTTLIVSAHSCTVLATRIKDHNDLFPLADNPVTKAQQACHTAFRCVQEAMVNLARSQACSPGPEGTARLDDVHAIYGSLLKTAFELSADPATVKGSTHAAFAAKFFGEALQYPKEITPLASQVTHADGNSGASQQASSSTSSTSSSSGSSSRSAIPKRTASEMAPANPQSHGFETDARAFKLPRSSL